ncbi:MAG: MIP/aquaporin family protein [Casimicrobiaceae bacterium]
MARRLTAEALGTVLLLAVVVGSGIMGERLAAGNSAIALLANSLATGCGLYVLITSLGPVSGAHFNPGVTIPLALIGEFPWRDVVPYVVVQIVAALLGVVVAHWMFELPAFTASTHVRTGPSQWWSEGVASFGLLVTIWLGHRARPVLVPVLVAAYITAAYWFTASTSFANPAVTIARATTDTFSGIHPGDVAGFIAAQFVGAIAAVFFARWLVGPLSAGHNSR